jgi:hypothetical protein
VVPSVIALLECREARAREDLESWLEALRDVEQHAAEARQRVEHARIAREEVLRALAEEGEGVAGRTAGASGTAPPPADDSEASSVPIAGVGGAVESASVGVPQSASAGASAVLRGGYDARPPQRLPGLGADALSGVYRQVFEVAVQASGPVSVQELTRALGRDAERMNEVEKVRHRAYALEARGWLVRERGGVFRAAAGPAGEAGARASAGAGAPSAG